jgi:hypothetical protein
MSAPIPDHLRPIEPGEERRRDIGDDLLMPPPSPVPLPAAGRRISDDHQRPSLPG